MATGNGRSIGVIVAAVVAAVLVLALAGVAGIATYSDATREADALSDDVPLAAFGPADLVDRLRREQAWQSARVIGLDEHLGLESGPDSPHDTEEAIADFRERLADVDSTHVAAYVQAVDGLAELEEIRTDVDAVLTAGPATRDNVDDGQIIAARYDDLIGAFDDAGDAAVLVLDNPDIRRAASLIRTVDSQLSLVAELVRNLLVVAVADGLNTPAEVSTLAALEGEWESERTRLHELADGRYAAVVDPYLPDLEGSALSGIVDRAIETGTIDIAGALDADDTDSAVLGELHAALTEELAADTTEVIDEARDRADRFRLLSVAAFGLAVALAVLAVVLAARAIRPTRPGAAGWPLPTPPRDPTPPPPPIGEPGAFSDRGHASERDEEDDLAVSPPCAAPRPSGR
jgi:hypothetical protein